MRSFLLAVFLLALPVHAATLLANNYGAKGDGIADDTRAIQKALYAAEAIHRRVRVGR